MSRNKGQASGKSSRASCTRTKLRFFRLGIACATIEPDARNGWACRVMTATIFVSYASEDHTVARTICEALENRGFGCWIASRDIQPGENFQVAIVRAIRRAKAMVMVFSTNASNSEEIKKELVLAGQSRLVVIPVRVEDVTPDEAFAYEFATRQWVDAFDDWEQSMQRLARQLSLIAGIDSSPEATPGNAATAQPVAARAIPALSRPAGRPA